MNMRLVSHAALGLMLAVGGTVMVAAPAMAAKEKKAEGPKADYSKAFIAVAPEMEKAEKAKDYAALKAAVDKSAPSASTPDDTFLLNYYRYQLGTNTSDEAVKKTGIEGMLASGKAPPEMAPQLEAMAGQYAFQANDMDGAIAHLEKASAAPSAAADVRYLLAEAYFSKAVKVGGGKSTPESQPLFAKGLASLQSAVDTAKASGQPVPASYYERGAEIARATGAAGSDKWALASLQDKSSPKAWSNLLNGFQDSHPTLTRGENLDVMRLKAATGSMMSASEYGEYAEAASKAGLVGEVKSIIEKGRAAGKLTPAQLADYYAPASGAVARDKASLPAAEADAGKAPTGKAAVAAADGYLSYGEYAKAASLYRTALQKGSVDAAEVNSRLGIALALGGDAAGAKSAFALVTTGSRKTIADYWTLWLSKQGA
jgi:tetratricopeptide (TPR) repeat protein